MTAAPACRHCRRRKASKPRGLCFACYTTDAVRALYPPADSKFNRRGNGLPGPGRRRLPAEPTSAAPGSAEKLAVLAARAERGELLWHPLDAVPAAAPTRAD